jgi:hypothetical protein
MRTSVKFEFVEFIPPVLEEGVLYITVMYKTAVHLCACGCGNQVVTPITPTDWKLIYDGRTVSLSPSIGNWNFECRSHYWIRNNTIVEALAWSDTKIDLNRERDKKKENNIF